MCGIAGIVRTDGAAPDSHVVRAMNDALAHRGPDGEGLRDLGQIVLGHRRLAVLDLSAAGAQPMTDASGRFHLTYNGEIYNYLELRAELESGGARFRSRTDTEVLLEGYAKWGARVLERLNGMFAFAIWDSRDRVLFAARDRFGEKPFFYVHDAGRELRFASEIKALRAAGLRTRPDDRVLFRFLAFGQTGTTDDTFLHGVVQLPPAHWLELRDGVLDVRRYWSLPAQPRCPEGSEDAHASRVLELLEDSVRLRLRSDVPVGSCLSGGIDSSAIVCLVARQLAAGAGGAATKRQETFSATFPDAPNDEREFARAVAQHAAVDCHEVAPDPAALAGEVSKLVAAQDEPFSGPAIYAEWKVMQLAKEHGVTVLLNGQGADEVFAGYHFFFADLWFGLLRRGRFRRLSRALRAYDAVHGAQASRAIFGAGVKSRAPRALFAIRGGPRLPWLSVDFVQTAAGARKRRPRDLRGSLRESLAHRMLPHLLRQTDRNSMAFSREARLPFLDHRLVEYVDALPDDRKLRGGITKHVLRAALRDVLPDAVSARTDKIGFAIPMAAWMRGPMAPLLRDTLSDRLTADRGILDAAGITTALSRFLAGDEAAMHVVWNAYLAETWMRTCVDD